MKFVMWVLNSLTQWHLSFLYLDFDVNVKFYHCSFFQSSMSWYFLEIIKLLKKLASPSTSISYFLKLVVLILVPDFGVSKYPHLLVTLRFGHFIYALVCCQSPIIIDLLYYALCFFPHLEGILVVIVMCFL